MRLTPAFFALLFASAVPVRTCRAAEATVSDKYAQVRGFKVEIQHAGGKAEDTAWESVSGGDLIIELTETTVGADNFQTSSPGHKSVGELTLRLRTKTILGSYSTSISIPTDQVGSGQGQELLKAIKEAKIIGNRMVHSLRCEDGSCSKSSVTLQPASADQEASIILGRDNDIWRRENETWGRESEFWSASLSCYYGAIATGLRSALTGALPARRGDNGTWSVNLSPTCVQSSSPQGKAAEETVVFRPHRGEVK